MKLLAEEITEAPKSVSFAESTEELNLIYKEGESRDFCFPPHLDIDLIYYRSGREMIFSGRFEGTLEGYCSRCLKTYSFPLEKDFDFVLTAEPFSSKSKVLSWEDMGLSYHAAEEINLSPLIREQVLLALPMRPLCNDNCRGLCPGCGANLNDEDCRCPSSSGDPRMALFRTLKIGR